MQNKLYLQIIKKNVLKYFSFNHQLLFGKKMESEER